LKSEGLRRGPSRIPPEPRRSAGDVAVAHPRRVCPLASCARTVTSVPGRRGVSQSRRSARFVRAGAAGIAPQSGSRDNTQSARSAVSERMKTGRNGAKRTETARDRQIRPETIPHPELALRTGWGDARQNRTALEAGDHLSVTHPAGIGATETDSHRWGRRDRVISAIRAKDQTKPENILDTTPDRRTFEVDIGRRWPSRTS
jgi:hypothetical protein